MNMDTIKPINGYACDIIEKLSAGLFKVGDQKTVDLTVLNFRGMHAATAQASLIDLSSDKSRQVIEIEITLHDSKNKNEFISTLFFKDATGKFYPARFWVRKGQGGCQNSIVFQSDAIPAIFFDELQEHHVTLDKLFFNKVILP